MLIYEIATAVFAIAIGGIVTIGLFALGRRILNILSYIMQKRGWRLNRVINSRPRY